MKATKKPITIDFLYYDGVKRKVSDWVFSLGDDYKTHFENEPMGTLYVKTLEGTSYPLVANVDVIIRGIKGEYYPCKKDIFEATYQPESDTPASAPIEGGIIRLRDCYNQYIHLLSGRLFEFCKLAKEVHGWSKDDNLERRIKALSRLETDFYQLSIAPESDEMINARKSLADILEIISTPKEGGVCYVPVPCSERLPDKEGWYMCIDIEGNEGGGGFNKYYFKESFPNYITAWLELRNLTLSDIPNDKK